MSIPAIPQAARGLSPAVVLALASLAAPATVAAQVESFDELGWYIESGMEAWRIPGLAIAVIDGDSTVYLEGFGVRKAGTDRPVDATTLFAVASITKSFTATALAMLVAEGKLLWDDPVSRYLPEFELYDPWVTRHLTVRDLLSHRAGYPGWAADHLWQGSDYDVDEILRRFRHQEPEGEFRSHYGYSNIMYIAAGEVVTAVTGESWETFVADHLLLPLGMTASTTSVAELESRDNVAMPHIETDEDVQVVPRYDPWNAASAMALNSSAADMALWVRLNLGRGVIAGDTLVPPAVLAEVYRPQVWWEGPESAAVEGRHFSAYGLGWDVYDYRGRPALRHSGSVDGMGSLITMLPEDDVGVVVLTNMVPHEFATALSNQVLDLLLGEPGKDWNAKFLELRKKARKKAKQEEWYWKTSRDKKAKRSLPIEEYLGVFSDSLSGTALVAKESGDLVFRYNDKYIGDLSHWQHDVYHVTWRDPYVSLWAGQFVVFVPDGKGGIGSVRVVFDNEVEFVKTSPSPAE